MIVSKGQISIATLLVSVVVVIILGVIIPAVVTTTSIANARTMLESRGYVVLTAGEYDNLNSKLDALKVSADLAVANAEAAVIAAEIAVAKVDLFNSAEVYLFPTTSNLTCLLTAGDTNTWSAWTEIEDSGTTTLSSKFSVLPGYVSDMLFFLPSDPSDGYNVELAYGGAKTNLGRVSFWALASGDIAYVLPIKSRRVPAGETVYYRMQTTGANGATVQARFRYFYE